MGGDNKFCYQLHLTVYFCITKDMNIKIVNDKNFFKCLLSKYSPQYDSFKWKNLNQKKKISVNKI